MPLTASTILASLRSRQNMGELSHSHYAQKLLLTARLISSVGHCSPSFTVKFTGLNEVQITTENAEEEVEGDVKR